MVILEYIIRNTVPGITPINVTNYSSLNIPKKMLFFKVLQSKAELKIKIHPLVINGLNPTSLKNITSSAYLPPEEIFILGLYVLRELDQLHFPLSLEKTLHTGCLFVCTLHKNHSAKGHQWPHFTCGFYTPSIEDNLFQTLEAFGHYLDGSFTVPWSAPFPI